MIEELFQRYMAVTDNPQAAATLVLAHVTAGKNRLLTVKEAANELGVHPNKVYDMAKKGEIRCQRVGRQIRFEPEALTEIVKDDRPRIAKLRECFN